MFLLDGLKPPTTCVYIYRDKIDKSKLGRKVVGFMTFIQFAQAYSGRFTFCCYIANTSMGHVGTWLNTPMSKIE